MTGRGSGADHRAGEAPGPDGLEAPAPGRRDAVLRELRVLDRPVGVAELAHRLGVHPNTVRFHLDKLVDAERVARVQGRGGAPGRPAVLYQAVRAMDPAGPRQFALLARVLVAALAAHPDPGAQAASAGREWGRERAMAGPGAGGSPVRRLLGLLDELGFAPEASPGVAAVEGDQMAAQVRGGEGWVGLHRCPFLELATASPSVVCPVHLGLMQGALGGWSADVTVDRLDPFVQPDLCLAHLAPA